MLITPAIGKTNVISSMVQKKYKQGLAHTQYHLHNKLEALKEEIACTFGFQHQGTVAIQSLVTYQRSRQQMK